MLTLQRLERVALQCARFQSRGARNGGAGGGAEGAAAAAAPSNPQAPLEHAPPAPHVVVCLHGFMSSKAKMVPVVERLRESPSVDTVVNYGFDGSLPTREIAARLSADLRAVVAESRAASVSFATHSWGAIVARCALHLRGCPRECHRGRMVMFAPPNRGSTFARTWSRSRLARMLMGAGVGSDLLSFSDEQRVRELVGGELPGW
jgi:triacylglycerol esterase/lipase EstA (alpha/beta hydrolase family)